MKKFFSITILLIVALVITTGFNIDDPYGSKPQSSSTSKTTTNQVSPVYTSYGTPVFTDNFDAANDTIALKARGYIVYNRSTTIGLTTWFTPTSVFPSFNGPAFGYVGANFNATTGAGNIDLWLVLPRVAGGTLAGDSLYFYSRSVYNSPYVDSIRVMYSATDSVYNGTWTELGRFKVNTDSSGSFNPWVRKGFRAPTASANGRFAIRYCVANGGPSGANSNYIGIDALTIERTSTPVVKVWSEQVSTLTTELNSVSAVSDDVAWSSGAAGKVVRTINKGLTWTNVSGDLPTANAGYVIWGFDANSAVVTTSPSSGAGARIFKTTNGGVNWVQTFYQSDGWGDGFYFKNATTGFFYGDHTGSRLSIFKTTDAGSTWDSTGQYFPTTSDGWNNAMFGLGDQVWIGTNSTSIAYTSNAGVSWSAQTTTAANTYAIWFNSATNGLAGGASAVFSTTNSGTNWAALTSPVTNNTTGLCGTGSEYWFTTFSALVYYSSNNGTTWSTQYTAPSSTFRHITRSRTGSTIWGVRTDGGISRYGDPIIGITPISTEIPKNFSLSQNYPNPFNPTTKINFALPKSGLVSLKVYDMLGKEVATLVNEVKSAGTYAVDFNGTSLSSGMYFYKISVNGFSEVKRMMLIK